MPASGLLTEADIVCLVRRFYALSLADDLLGPLFREAIDDFEAHYVVVENFWSQALLGTSRYRGQPYPAHTHLKVAEEHFVRWMACFAAAANECLPPADAIRALARAEQMTASFRSGLLPLPLPRNRRAKASGDSA